MIEGSDMYNLNGKTAIITGASKGIGLATAHFLADCGANVVLAARSEGTISDVAAKIRDNGSNATAIATDVSDYTQVERLTAITLETYGAIDVLVNNAGVIDPISRLEISSPADWATAVNINLTGVYFGMRAVLPHMIARSSGTIINMSSGAANSALEGWSHYCSTKAAVKKLTECAHVEVADKGITIVGLSPGTVATDMMAKIKNSGINPVSQLNWDGHLSPDWPAKAIAYLCTPDARKYAGTDFSIKTEEGRKIVGLK